MTKRVVILLVAGLAGPALAAAAEPPEANRFWPQWRGPLATGVAPHARPPVEWSETKNVRWKVEVPGRGSSSPIVWSSHGTSSPFSERARTSTSAPGRPCFARHAYRTSSDAPASSLGTRLTDPSGAVSVMPQACTTFKW